MQLCVRELGAAKDKGRRRNAYALSEIAMRPRMGGEQGWVGCGEGKRAAHVFVSLVRREIVAVLVISQDLGLVDSGRIHRSYPQREGRYT